MTSFGTSIFKHIQKSPLLNLGIKRIFKIIQKNIHTSTYEIEKVENDDRLNRQRFKVHHRIIKKLNKKLDVPSNQPVSSNESMPNSTKTNEKQNSTDTKNKLNESKKKNVADKNESKIDEKVMNDTRRSTPRYNLRSTSKTF